MAIFHLEANTLTKSKQDSALGHFDYMVAYNACQESAARVIHTGAGNMPTWANNGSRAFWEAVDLFERRNGRLCKSLMIALPMELTHAETLGLTERYIAQATTLHNGQRLPYSYAVHAEQPTGHNPHLHLMVSERITDSIDRIFPSNHFKRFNPKDPVKGGAQKTDALKPREWLLNQRETWAQICNEALEHKHVKPIDHRSLAERGIDREPEQHLGPRRSKEKKMLETEERAVSREIFETLKSIHEYGKRISRAEADIFKADFEIEELLEEEKKTPPAPAPPPARPSRRRVEPPAVDFFALSLAELQALMERREKAHQEAVKKLEEAQKEIASLASYTERTREELRKAKSQEREKQEADAISQANLREIQARADEAWEAVPEKERCRFLPGGNLESETPGLVRKGGLFLSGNGRGFAKARAELWGARAQADLARKEWTEAKERVDAKTGTLAWCKDERGRLTAALAAAEEAQRRASRELSKELFDALKLARQKDREEAARKAEQKAKREEREKAARAKERALEKEPEPGPGSGGMSM